MAKSKRSQGSNSGSKSKSGQAIYISVIIILNIAWILLFALPRLVPSFAPWYTETIYPALEGSFGRVFGVFPISISELLVYLLPCILILDLIIHLIIFLRNKKKMKSAYSFYREKENGFIGILKRVIFTASLLAFLYFANCGVNYYSTSFAEKEGFTHITNDNALLTEFCEYIASALTENSNEISTKTDEESVTFDLTKPSEQAAFYTSGIELERNAVDAMKKIGTIYPSLSGYYPLPKGLFNPRPFSNMGVTGIYSPFTIEANYNSEMTPYNLPFTACHELSHLRGYMNESEANFIGFLACVNSDNIAFKRSGLMMAWIYAGNQLYKVDQNAYTRIHATLPDDAKKELADNNQFWDTYETKASEVQDKVNNEYLIGNGISEGIRSYDMVVELLLSWYKDYL